MYLIYKILKEIRYIMRSKSMKRLITLALLIVLLSMLCSRVFAFEIVDENENSFTFTDFVTDTLDTENNINDYYLVVIDLGSVYSGTRFWCYFFPKEYSSNLILVRDTRSNTVTLYLSPPENNFTYYKGLYDSNFDKSSNNLYSYTTNSRLSNNYLLDSSSYSNFSILYSDLDIMSYNEYTYCNYSLSLSTTEQTQEHIYIYTNWLKSNFSSNYAVHMVMYPNTENSLNIELPTEINPDNNNQYRYYFEAEENGDYMFVFRFNYNDYSSLKTETITVSNIITNTGGETGGGEQGGTGERWL